MNNLGIAEASTKEATYNEVTCFDGSIGKYGQYARVSLPRPMTKQEARDWCKETDRCPPEAFNNTAQ
jgi:hypothetical protein